MYHHLSFIKSSTSKSHWGGCWDSFHLILKWKSLPSVLPSSSPSDLCLKVVDIPYDFPDDWFSMSAWTPGSPDEALFLDVGVSSAMKLVFASVESTDGPSEWEWSGPSPLNRTSKGGRMKEGVTLFPASGLKWGITVHLLLPRKGFTPLTLWVLRLWTQTEPYLWALGSEACRWQRWDLPASRTTQVDSCNKSPTVRFLRRDAWVTRLTSRAVLFGIAHRSICFLRNPHCFSGWERNYVHGTLYPFELIFCWFSGHLKIPHLDSRKIS